MYPLILLLIWNISIQLVNSEIINIPTCCQDGWSLVTINGGLFGSDKYDCIELIGNFTGNFEVIGNTSSVYGYGILQTNLTDNLPDCDHTKLIKIADGEQFKLPRHSCINYINNRLTAVYCDSEKETDYFELGFAAKCCPPHFVYNAEQKKCKKHDIIDFQIYETILNNNVAVFANSSIDCPSTRALVEYHMSSNEFSIDNNKLVITTTKEQFSQIDFCIEAIIDNDVPLKNLSLKQKFLVRICDEMSVCAQLPCIRRCCKDGEMYVKGNGTTICKSDESDVPFNSFESLQISGNFTKPPVFGVLRSLNCLKFRLDPDSYDDEAHTISSVDGSLYKMVTQKKYSNNQYCVERTQNSSWPDRKLYSFICFDSKDVGSDKIRFQLYPIGLLISCCFYAITLLVYLSISKLRNLPGKILICLVSSLFSAYLGIALGQLMPTPNDDICFVFGFFVYFCLMAAFAWMNMMCFDIWQTFGSAKTSLGLKEKTRKRFILYSLYGWGLPTILTVTTVSLTKSNLLSDNIRPHFGHGRCWFTYDNFASANLVFFSGPVGILFLINFVFFLLTLRYCNRVKREIHRMQSSNMEKPALRRRFFIDKTRFAMNTKLFVVMGITWLLEILSILFYDHKKTFFWAISDSFNVLLGVFVCYIFVCKKRVWHAVLEKYGCRSKESTQTAHHATCATQSSYTQSMSVTRINALEGNTSLISSNPSARCRSPNLL